jgi:hypothetical protein
MKQSILNKNISNKKFFYPLFSFVILLLIIINVFIYLYSFNNTENNIEEFKKYEIDDVDDLVIDYNRDGRVNYDEYYTNAKCPENSTKDEMLSTYWYQRKDYFGINPNASLVDFLEYRVEFLKNHNCEKTIEEAKNGDWGGFMQAIVLNEPIE